VPKWRAMISSRAACSGRCSIACPTHHDPAVRHEHAAHLVEAGGPVREELQPLLAADEVEGRGGTGDSQHAEEVLRPGGSEGGDKIALVGLSRVGWSRSLVLCHAASFFRRRSIRRVAPTCPSLDPPAKKKMGPPIGSPTPSAARIWGTRHPQGASAPLTRAVYRPPASPQADRSCLLNGPFGPGI
jgi:hypothetical protein